MTDNQKNEQWFITKTMEREKLIEIIIEYELQNPNYTDYVEYFEKKGCNTKRKVTFGNNLDITYKKPKIKKPTEIKYGVPKQLI